MHVLLLLDAQHERGVTARRQHGQDAAHIGQARGQVRRDGAWAKRIKVVYSALHMLLCFTKRLNSTLRYFLTRNRKHAG